MPLPVADSAIKCSNNTFQTIKHNSGNLIHYCKAFEPNSILNNLQQMWMTYLPFEFPFVFVVGGDDRKVSLVLSISSVIWIPFAGGVPNAVYNLCPTCCLC